MRNTTHTNPENLQVAKGFIQVYIVDRGWGWLNVDYIKWITPQSGMRVRANIGLRGEPEPLPVDETPLQILDKIELAKGGNQ